MRRGVAERGRRGKPRRRGVCLAGAAWGKLEAWRRDRTQGAADDATRAPHDPHVDDDRREGGRRLDVSAMGSACAREDWEDARVAILGDVHGNAHALREAMRAIERAGIAQVVFHGDLLTYGCTPRACIALLDQLVLRFDAVLLAGNHEPFYFEGQQGAFGVFERKKPFLVESIHWTLKRIEDVTLASRYRWHDVCVFDDVLVSHANPFDRPNWRYLNTARDDAEAAEALAKRGARIGVFGAHAPRAPQRCP